MATIPMRPLGFGEIVDGAVQLYRRDFGLYYLIGLVCSLPEFVLVVLWNPWELVSTLEALEPSDDPTVALEQMGSVFGSLGIALLILFVGLAFLWFAALSLTVAINERIEERPTSVGAAFRGALPKIASAAGATIVALLIFTVVQFIATIFGALILVAIGSADALLSILVTLLGSVILLLVFAFWMGATFAIFPAVVIEGRPAMDALTRSLSLCRGGWLRVIGIMVVALIIQMAPGLAIQGLFGTWVLFQSPEELASIGPLQQWLFNTADLVVGPLTIPFMVGCVVMLFHDRRVRSEAYDLERLADEMGNAGS